MLTRVSRDNIQSLSFHPGRAPCLISIISRGVHKRGRSRQSSSFRAESLSLRLRSTLLALCVPEPVLPWPLLRITSLSYVPLFHLRSSYSRVRRGALADQLYTSLALPLSIILPAPSLYAGRRAFERGEFGVAPHQNPRSRCWPGPEDNKSLDASAKNCFFFWILWGRQKSAVWVMISRNPLRDNAPSTSSL